MGLNPAGPRPCCVTLDKTLNLSEPQSVPFPFPQATWFHLIQSHGTRPFYPSSPGPQASLTLPPPSAPSESSASSAHLHDCHPVRCQILSPPPRPPLPPNTGVAAFPSGPSAPLLWSRPGRLSPGFVQQPSKLLSASSHLPSGSSRTIFLKWKAGRVYLTHPDCAQRQAHTPSPAAGKACHHLVTAPAPSLPSSLSAPLPPARLGNWMCLGLPRSLCTHPLCS